MNIQVSILSLAKSNNGFFKSKKQAEFLIAKIKENSGCIGFVSSAYNSCPLFASFDENGITKIEKDSKTKKGIVKILMFEREVDGVLNTLQLKKIKLLNLKLKKLEKTLKERKLSFESGSYNGTMDISTYEPYMIELYERKNKEIESQIISLKLLIKK